jgi:ABC-type branched-subunit amino acid transport system substrate-binding protein
MKKIPVMTLLFFLLGTLFLVACGSPADVQNAVEDAVNEVAPTLQAAADELAPTVEAAVEEIAPTVEAAVEEVAPTVEAAATEVAEAMDEEMRTDNLEGETITFYHFGDLSGPLAGITGPLINGFNDAVAAVNANGGIRGAQIELEFTDTKSSVDEAVAAYNLYAEKEDGELVNNPLVMFTYGSGDGEALASRFVEDQIPNLAAGLSSVAFYGPESGYTFGYAPIYPDQFALFLDYITANWADLKPEAAGDEIKLAYISWPTAYGQGAITDESVAYAESLGIEIVANELIDPSPTADATTAILNAQAAGANVIYTNTLAFGPASILNGLGALGLRNDFLFGANNWAMDISIYAFVSDPALVEGMISPFPYLFWSDADNPGVQYAEEQFALNERTPGEHGVGYLLTFAGVDLAVKAIELAIDKVGFDNLTGADVQAALIELGPTEILDGVMRVDFSNDNRSPHEAQIRQVQGGQFVMLQDWTATPDLRPAENFANQ